jgi:hypothetical protein
MSADDHIQSDELADVQGGNATRGPIAKTSYPTFPRTPPKPYETKPDLYLGKYDVSYEAVHPTSFLGKLFSFGGR